MIRAAAARGFHFSQRVVRRLRRTSDLWRERQWERDRLAFSAAIPDSELTALLRRMAGCTFGEYCEDQRRRTEPRTFLPRDRTALVGTLRADYPDEAAAIVATADRLLQGTFDVLGSGPVDMRRRATRAAGRLDWDRDPITGRTFPREASHWRGMVPGTYASVRGDIKGPWEIGRCQHLPTVGQAYLLTGDERYARAFAATIADFISRNPAGFGVQWGCAMDVALRLVSWILALDFVQGSPALTQRWWAMFLRSVVEHGRFIAANLEFGTIDGRIATSNHYLADVFGLYWLASTFPELDTNVVWRGLSEHALEREIRVQLNPDGSSFESSVPYHRLVTEMFLSSAALAASKGRRFSDEYTDRLLKALAFIRVLRQPGGRLPQIGDADNGRAHILAQYGRWEQESMDHLLAVGARVHNWPALGDGLASASRVEALFWDASAPVASTPDLSANPAVLPDFGVAILRAAGTTVTLSNGPVGTSGFGNHKHCDQLAVELVVGSQPVFVDGGTYLYTSDPAARNHFRGTASHNTVMVDGVEQHDFRPEWLFRMFQTGTATLETCRSDDALCVSGSHTAYTRLTPAVIHRRDVWLSTTGVVTIDDTLDAATGHEYRWHFLLHPAVRPEAHGEWVGLSWQGGAARFIMPRTLTAQIADGWYSPAYGVRLPTKSIIATTSDASGEVRFVLEPST